MKAADLVVVTGSQDNVRRAAMSGTPAIGVGVGNVPVIIDETADLADAARKIRASKIFDNSTSCSSENSVIILDTIYDKAIAALQDGRRLSVHGAGKGRGGAGAVASRQAQPASDRAWLGYSGARLSGCRRKPRAPTSSSSRTRAPAGSIRSPARSSRWSSPSIASRILPRPRTRSAPCSIIKARAIPAVFAPRT